MAMLNREALLKKEELKREKVDLGNGEFVYVRQMTGREKDQFDQSLVEEVKDERGNVVDYQRSLKDFRAKLAVNTICDDKGEIILKPEDYQKLSKHMSASRLEKIIEVAQRLNSVTEQAQDLQIKN